MPSYKTEFAAGGIITKFNHLSYSIDVLLVLTKKEKGYWGFPKGHMELNETLIETSIREIKEETNLDVLLLDPKITFVSKYFPFENVFKEVTYFWFKPLNPLQLKIQHDEITKAIWIDYKNVQKTLTYDNDKNIFQSFLEKLKLPTQLEIVKKQLIV